MRLSQKYFHTKNSQGVSEALKYKILRLRKMDRTEVRNRALISKAIRQLGTSETPSLV